MLRNLSIVVTVLFTSLLLTMVQEGAGSESQATWVCKNKINTAFLVDRGKCHCLLYPPIESPNFGAGYTYIEGIGAYKFHNELKTWNDARKICQREGAQLAILDSDTEQKALTKLFRETAKPNKNNRFFWLGIHDIFEEGNWITLFGRPLNYSPWIHQNGPKCWYQPDNGANKHPAQNCGSFDTDCNGLDDHECTFSAAFFCEKPVSCP